MEYLDFEIEIGRPVDDRYPIAVRSPAGEARADVQLPALDDALRRSVVAGRDVAVPGGGEGAGATSTSLQAFGRALFDAVFVGEIPARFAVTRERAANAGRGIRIRIRCLTPSSAMLPWELMYDGTRRQYLALSAKTVACRYLELPDPPEPLAVAPPLRVLVMISTPSGVAPLDGAGERHRIEAATSELTRSGKLTIDWLEGASATYETLRRRMAAPWHVFHFIGHGRFDATTGGGELGFTEEPLAPAAAVPGTPGAVQWVRGDKIGVLSHGAAPLRLAVLNCCRSAESDEASLFASTATQIAASGVPAVVAMQQVVGDASAIAFAGELYDAIARRLPVDTAVAMARKAMMSAENDDFGWALPVLYLRSPDGQLFTHEAVPVPHVPPPVAWYRRSIAPLVGVSALVIAVVAGLAFKYLWFDEPARPGKNTAVAPIMRDAPVCGNGIVDPGEECDDGNAIDGDGCNINCRLPRCGNGILDPGEQCDGAAGQQPCGPNCMVVRPAEATKPPDGKAKSDGDHAIGVDDRKAVDHSKPKAGKLTTPGTPGVRAPSATTGGGGGGPSSSALRPYGEREIVLIQQSPIGYEIDTGRHPKPDLHWIGQNACDRLSAVAGTWQCTNVRYDTTDTLRKPAKDGFGDLGEPLTEGVDACTRSPVAMEPSTTRINWAVVTCKRVK